MLPLYKSVTRYDNRIKNYEIFLQFLFCGNTAESIRFVEIVIRKGEAILLIVSVNE